MQDGTEVYVDASGMILKVEPATQDEAPAEKPETMPADMVAEFANKIKTMEEEMAKLKDTISKMNTQNTSAYAKVEKHEKILPEMFSLIEKIGDLPTGETPAEISKPKFSFSKTNDKNERRSQFGAALSELKKVS